MRRRRALSEMVSFRRRLLVLIRVQRAVSRTVTMGSSATGRAGDRRRCTSDIGLTATAPLSQCPDINTSGTEWLPSAHATAAHDIGQHAAATARCGMLRGIYCGLLLETKCRRRTIDRRLEFSGGHKPTPTAILCAKPPPSLPVSARPR